MKLIVGLGNPGKEYINTRHNIGFMFIDKIASEYNLKFKLDTKLKAEISEVIINNTKVLLAKPQTFMNLSGEAVRNILSYYKIDIDDILVVYDDLALPLGKVRIRKSGSSGGHNGIKNIIELLKTNDIKRIRIGIGSPNTDQVSYVLGAFSKTELIILDKTISQAKEMLNTYLVSSFDDFMNKFNRSNTDE